MRMLRRINRLEHRQRGVWVEQHPEQDPRAQLQTLMNADTPIVAPMLGRLVELMHKGDALAERGECLSPEECDEGKRLAVELTERMRIAHAATKHPTEPIVIPFNYQPFAEGNIPVCAGGKGDAA